MEGESEDEGWYSLSRTDVRSVTCDAFLKRIPKQFISAPRALSADISAVAVSF